MLKIENYDKLNYRLNNRLYYRSFLTEIFFLGSLKSLCILAVELRGKRRAD